MSRLLFPTTLALLAAAAGAFASSADSQEGAGMNLPIDSRALFAVGSERTEAIRVTDAICYAEGFGNTFMVSTPEGNVIIDTSLPWRAPQHKKLLQEVDASPVKYVILTHGHIDHRGGVSLWKDEDTEVIAQENFVELRHYQERLRGIFARRNAAQFDLDALPTSIAGNYGASIEATVLFDKTYRFELGGITFELFHTPGETYDALTVWIPELKAAFVGDNLYESFPNLYTLRGTKPRWALDYVESLDLVLDLKPELVLPSHGVPIDGKEAVAKALERYRDAILYVHDATVRGMNEGKDVYTLMQEVRLPPELQIGEGYGRISWSVRGIYEGYMGWFDGNPATMFATPPASAYPELVRMAGGADAVAKRATELVQTGALVEGLHLAEMALAAEPNNQAALRARLGAFQALKEQSTNSNERSWLSYGIRTTEEKLTSDNAAEPEQ